MEIFNPTERDERRYLKQVLGNLTAYLKTIEDEILEYSDKLIASKRFGWENAEDLDKVERAAMRITANEDSIFGERALAERARLQKLVQSPYFGRVDFATLRVNAEDHDDTSAKPYYIGIHSFFDNQQKKDIVIDWRAPVSSVFYDFETGPASYSAPEGDIEGNIERKRQYRIRGGKMEYMLESELNIGDDILQQELSRASDDKMKNIVATIQKEQNRIIRDSASKVLIIQGAAGSGKTSIALHRVAFLLYRNRHTLKAEDVLILSPNRVFGSYISNVLPELGEENIPQLAFEDIARKLLGRGRKFQSFARQAAGLIECLDEKTVERIRYKATNEFVAELDAFLREMEGTCFRPEDIRIEGLFVSAGALLADYRRLRHMPIKKRLEKIANDQIAAYRREHERPLSLGALRQVKERVQAMFFFKDSLSLYKRFYEDEPRLGLYAEAQRGELEYCDVFPLCFVKLFFEGVQTRYHEINHLLIDEMQDYTPIQYAVIAKLFRCRMTILGDKSQSVNPYASSSMERIELFFSGVTKVQLQKSYRSTIEITRFSLKIRDEGSIIPVERHGAEPTVSEYADEKEEIAAILTRIEDFEHSEYQSLGIIAKSQPQADRLLELLSAKRSGIVLLDFGSTEFSAGITVTSCHMAKGLEFDQVIIPACTRDNYRTELDRGLLYIAATRAMHRLDVTCTWEHGGKSALLP